MHYIKVQTRCLDTYTYLSAVFPYPPVHNGTSIPLLPSKLAPPAPELHLLLLCFIYQLPFINYYSSNNPPPSPHYTHTICLLYLLNIMEVVSCSQSLELLT